MKRIRRFGVLQTSKVAAIIYFLLSLVFAVPFALISSVAGAEAFPGFPAGGGIAMAILLPIIYAVFGFISTAIGCLIYNAIAGWVGGIEFEVEVAPDVSAHEEVLDRI